MQTSTLPWNLTSFLAENPLSQFEVVSIPSLFTSMALFQGGNLVIMFVLLFILFSTRFTNMALFRFDNLVTKKVSQSPIAAHVILVVAASVIAATCDALYELNLVETVIDLFIPNTSVFCEPDGGAAFTFAESELPTDPTALERPADIKEADREIKEIETKPRRRKQPPVDPRGWREVAILVGVYVGYVVMVAAIVYFSLPKPPEN